MKVLFKLQAKFTTSDFSYNQTDKSKYINFDKKDLKDFLLRLCKNFSRLPLSEA